jgi:chemotaxis-related protein WspB
VLGLLAFRGGLLPVVDLCHLVLARPCAEVRGTRIIVLAAESGRRRFGLLAEEVLDTVPVARTLPGLRLPEQPWLGDLLGEGGDDPQLLEPDHLLPEALAALFEPQGAA